MPTPALLDRGLVATGSAVRRRLPWRRPPGALLCGLLVAALVAGTAAVVALASGPVARSMPLDDGTAWLVSSKSGQAALVDGASGQLVTQVPVGEGDLSAAQAGSDVFVANSTTGTVTRIDGTTDTVSGKARVAEPKQALTVFAGDTAVYTVSATAGTVTVADPRTLRPTGTQSLGERVRPGAALVDGGGRLWLVDGDSGDLVSLDRGTRRVTARVDDPSSASLVLAGGRVVVVDQAARTVRQVIGGGELTAPTCLQTRAGDDTVAISGSATRNRVFAASGSRGVLLVSDLDRHTCDGVVDLGRAGDRLGPAREVAGLVFVPDYTSGQVAIVDLSAARVVARAKVLPGGTPFDLVPGSSFVFFNDPDSQQAGVVHLDGSTVRIRKYDPGRKGDLLAPGDDGSGNGGGDPAGGGRSAGPTSPVTPTTAAPTARVAIETSARQVQVGQSVTLRAVVLGGGRLSDVRWSFGDASASGVGAQVAHSWTTPSTYTVSARATLADGRQATPTVQITVRTQSRTEVTGPPQINLSTGTNGGDGGGGPRDGGVDTGPRTGGGVDTGPGAGGDGATGTPPVAQPPKASLTVTRLSGASAVRADASGSTAGSSPIVSYAFRFTDGFQAAQTSPTADHTLSGGGTTYHITVRVTDQAGLTSDASVDYSVAVATLTVRVVGDGSVVSDPSGINCGAGAECRADFPDGTAVTLHARAGAGQYLFRWDNCAAGGDATTCTVTDDKAQQDRGQVTAANFASSTPLGTPTGLTGGAFTAPQSISVSWQPVSGAQHYAVEVFHCASSGSCAQSPFQTYGTSNTHLAFDYARDEAYDSGDTATIGYRVQADDGTYQGGGTASDWSGRALVTYTFQAPPS